MGKRLNNVAAVAVVVAVVVAAAVAAGTGPVPWHFYKGKVRRSPSKPRRGEGLHLMTGELFYPWLCSSIVYVLWRGNIVFSLFSAVYF